MDDPTELTLDKLRAAIQSIGPMPPMPRWKDLTRAQRNMVEREIDTTKNPSVRNAMWEAYYCANDDCPWHGPAVPDRRAVERER